MGHIATRQMADPAFRAAQLAGLRQPHVASINQLVDELREQGPGWVPYVAPYHGGVDAHVLSVLSDPGPMTADEGGSGCLCIQNDDPTAERQVIDFADAGIDPGRVTPWNAYPWYRHGKGTLTASQLRAGVIPLVRLIELMPDLHVVLLQGRQAQAGWRYLQKGHSQLTSHRGVTVIATFHPSRQALFHPSAERRARLDHRRSAYAEVAAALA